MSTRKSSICIEKKEKEKNPFAQSFQNHLHADWFIVNTKISLSLLFPPKAHRNIFTVATSSLLPSSLPCQSRRRWIFSFFIILFRSKLFSLTWISFFPFYYTQNPSSWFQSSSCQLSHSYNNMKYKMQCTFHPPQRQIISSLCDASSDEFEEVQRRTNGGWNCNLTPKKERKISL